MKLKRLQTAELKQFAKRFGKSLPDPFAYQFSWRKQFVFFIYVYLPWAVVVGVIIILQRIVGVYSEAAKYATFAGIAVYYLVALALMRVYSNAAYTEARPKIQPVLDFINTTEPDTHLVYSADIEQRSLFDLGAGYSISGTYHGKQVWFNQSTTAGARSGRARARTSAHVQIGQQSVDVEPCYTLQGMIVAIDQVSMLN